MLARELPLAPLTDRTRPLEPVRVADSPDAHRMRPRRIAARGFPLRELPRPAPQPTTGPLAPATFEGMVGETPVMLELFGFIRRLAPYPTTALITGESGTGKELVARAIHRLSPRSGRPLVVCNCTTLTPTLVETELFGHVRGAFTGADRDHKGLFETADGSTIFLDEVGDLPLAAQVKLLRVLEEYEIRRVGSSEPTRVDVRVVAATNRDLTEMVATGAFRTDLYFRLNVGAIHLAPLRERPDDLDAARAPLPRALEPAPRPARLGHQRTGVRDAPAAQLAGERARAGQRHRARDGGVGWQPDPSGSPAAAARRAHRAPRRRRRRPSRSSRRSATRSCGRSRPPAAGGRQRHDSSACPAGRCIASSTATASHKRPTQDCVLGRVRRRGWSAR